jgi:hypothetical protein
MKKSLRYGKKSMQGVTLLATLFILIILALAGVYLLKIGATSQHLINYRLLTDRANLAALSGLELAKQQWLQNPGVCPQKSVHFDRSAKALNGFDVVVDCSSLVSYPAQNPQFYSVKLQARASYGKFGDREFVSHKITRAYVLENKLSN